MATDEFDRQTVSDPTQGNWGESGDDPLANAPKAVASGRSAPPSYSGPGVRPKYGYEAFLDHELNSAGRMKQSGSGKNVKVGYEQGPYQGMTPGEAQEAARAKYDGMSDDDRKNWENIANAGDVRSNREAQAVYSPTPQSTTPPPFNPAGGGAAASPPPAAQSQGALTAAVNAAPVAPAATPPPAAPPATPTADSGRIGSVTGGPGIAASAPPPSPAASPIASMAPPTAPGAVPPPVVGGTIDGLPGTQVTAGLKMANDARAGAAGQSVPPTIGGGVPPTDNSNAMASRQTAPAPPFSGGDDDIDPATGKKRQTNVA